MMMIVIHGYVNVHRLMLKNAYDPYLYHTCDLQSRWNTVCRGWEERWGVGGSS